MYQACAVWAEDTNNASPCRKTKMNERRSLLRCSAKKNICFLPSSCVPVQYAGYRTRVVFVHADSIGSSGLQTGFQAWLNSTKDGHAYRAAIHSSLLVLQRSCPAAVECLAINQLSQTGFFSLTAYMDFVLLKKDMLITQILFRGQHTLSAHPILMPRMHWQKQMQQREIYI